MSEKTSVLLSDVNLKGDIVEKEQLILDCKIEGDVTAGKLNTHSGSNIKGNINSDKISIRSTAEVEGVLNQKNLSIEEGAKLKIKAETY